MRITSIYFLIFLVFSVTIYYLFPKKYRFYWLLGSSLCFFFLSNSLFLFFYMLFGVVLSYIGANLMEKIKKEKSRKIILFIVLFCLFAELSILKYINIFPMTMNAIGGLFNLNLSFQTLNLLAPLGISYYTLSLTSYVVDVYRTTSKAEKNFFKHLLFVCYYPLLISGPVVRYNDMKEELFTPKKFSFQDIVFGSERILFGLMKKLVIADQIARLVQTIFSEYNQYTGFYLLLAVFLYAIQIYTDFSGCMDIVIGASRMYGVKLKENFDSPFFSRTLSEFWRRWHISLGTWGKDYIMYPLLKSSFFQKLNKKCRKIFGKKVGKKIPTILAILILWLFIGLWHGASYKYIFAAGVLPWIYLTVGEFVNPVIKNGVAKLNIKTDCFSYHLFQSLRTYFFMCIIWLVACAPSLKESITILKNIFIPMNLSYREFLPQLSVLAILFALGIVMVVDYLNYKDIDVYEWFAKQNLLFRFVMVCFILSLILIYGAYGPGYNATDFIYGGF